jgi:hypothetical protein
MELALCHPSGTHNFEAVPRVFESLCISRYNTCLILLNLKPTCAHNFVNVHSLEMEYVKFINAQQGTPIYHFKGINKGLYKTNASIWIGGCVL